MYKFINIDRAAELVKDIDENNCCAVCGSSNGRRMRYHCGHTSCESCVPATDSCPFCLTPQDHSTFTAPLLDKPYTQRSRNAIELLNVFQNEFNTDVYKRHRISEQLKVEKELFPKCIQAPAKYFNKRKSSKPSTDNKENTTTIFPGEEVSFLSKMENSNANVREWLSKNVKRKPLADLNHTRSTLNRTSLQKSPQKMLNTQINSLARINRKRIYSEINSDINKTFIEPLKNRGKENTVLGFGNNKRESSQLHKNNNDDSGIAIDDVIVIDDSQSVCVDKDLKAWQAVLDAEKYAQRGSHDTPLSGPTQAHVKVPFYKKSLLFKKCESCNEFYDKISNYESEDTPKTVSITVESKSYIVIINVSKADDNKKENSIHSVGIQTDYNILSNKESHQDHEKEAFFRALSPVRASSPILKASSPIPRSSKSEDIFMGDANKLNFSLINKTSNVIIADSDSDDDLEASTSLQVTVDVHKSYDEISVLDDVEDLMGHSKRPRRRPRGHTPTSTDSSDKENYNPNRSKKDNNSKKKPIKK